MAYIGKSPSGTGAASQSYITQSSGGGSVASVARTTTVRLSRSQTAIHATCTSTVFFSLPVRTTIPRPDFCTVAGLAALASGDVVEVVVYDIFAVADTVSATQMQGTLNKRQITLIAVLWIRITIRSLEQSVQ